MNGTSCPAVVSTKLQRIAKLARQSPEMVMTTLSHHIDLDFLREAYRRTRKDGAAGIDGQSGRDYADNLEAKLEDLLVRFKSGRYRAPAVRRVHIPKGSGKTRPIGIPTFEDKVLQRAVAMVLDAVYEQDFLSCSYGFRPGRSAHQALESLWKSVMAMRGGWVVEIDIKSFFDNLDHGHLRGFLNQRVRDGVLRRVIDKWLKAGVLEGGQVRRSKAGTPQGGVVSPLLANVYLHHVLDVWFERNVLPRTGGQAFLVRYADDAAIVFAREEDARGMMVVMPKRFGRYGLTLHPEKTRLVRFSQPPYRWSAGRHGNADAPGSEGPGTFDLLGFTHYWGKTRRGGWALFRKTAPDRFRRAVRNVYTWLRRHRHLSIAEQHRHLTWMLRGHWAYYGITGNHRRLAAFRFAAIRVWQKWLNRRSQGNHMPWDRYSRLLKRYPLPSAKVVHSVSRRVAKPCS